MDGVCPRSPLRPPLRLPVCLAERMTARTGKLPTPGGVHKQRGVTPLGAYADLLPWEEIYRVVLIIGTLCTPTSSHIMHAQMRLCRCISVAPKHS